MDLTGFFLSVFLYKRDLKQFFKRINDLITLYALLRIFHTNGIKKQIAFIGVGYDDKNDDDREI